MKKTWVFTGSYTQPLLNASGQLVAAGGEGIGVYSLSENGALQKLAATGAENPSYLALHPNKRRLYAANELKEYSGIASSSVSAYDIDLNTGALRPLGRQPTYGEDACNLSLAPGGSHLLAANYSGGSVCAYPLEADGTIGKPSCFLRHSGQGPDPVRQTAPHAHQIITDPTGKHVLACDLGADEVAVYGTDWEKGYLIPTGMNIKTGPGSGPRHCVFGPGGTRLYLLAELMDAVQVYEYTPETAGTRLLQTISTLPAGWAGENTASGIRLHPGGKLLFASNRGHNSLAAYRLGEGCQLTLLHHQPTGGRTPRDFDISPCGSFLVVGNQESDELVVFAIDAESGQLTELGRQSCGAVTSVLIANMEDVPN